METIRYTLEAVRPGASRPGDFPDNTGPLSEDDKKKIYQQYRRGDAGRDAGQALSPHQDQHLSRHQRDAGAADPGAAARLHPESAVRPGRRREDDSGRRCPSRDAPAKKTRLPSGLAAVPGQPVRSAAADARAGSALVPQVQLPEVSRPPSCATSSIRRGPRAA